MNFLELVNRTRVECGVTGPALATAQNLTGEAARIASWVTSAWVDIQTSKEDWLFMRSTVTFNSVTHQQFYTPAEAGIGSTFANWKRDSFRCSSVGQNYADEQLMNYMEYTTFRNLYMYGNMRTTYSRPVVATIDGTKRLGLGSIPDQAYVIDGEYYVKPIELSADTDSPALPTNFHMLVVYRAMYYYAGYESAPEVYQRAEFEFQRLMQRLNIDQLPTLVSGPPLA